MARRFQLVEVEYQDYDTDLIGVSKDAVIRGVPAGSKIRNFGALSVNQVNDNGTKDHFVIEIQMPNEADIIGFGIIEKVELLLNRQLGSAESIYAACIEISDEWDEGDETGGVDNTYCNWEDAQPGVAWKVGDGAIDSDWQSLDDSETVIDSVIIGASNSGIDSWDLTSALSMGNKKTFVFFVLDSGTGSKGGANWVSREGFAAGRPILKVTYRSYPPDGFTEDGDKLRIEPNPDNPEQPKLTWGPVKDEDFSQYKIYRDTSPITVVEDFKTAINDVDVGAQEIELSSVDLRDAFTVGSTFKVTGNATMIDRLTVAAVSLVTGDTIIQTVEALGSKAIASFADGGGGTVIATTSVSHGLAGGNQVYIYNTTNYNGLFSITFVSATQFRFTDTWAGTETGDFVHREGDVHHGIWASPDSAIEEFIDTFSHVDGTKYYYRLIAEDQDNHEDDGLKSATVFFTKPDISTGSLSPSGAQNVGTSSTVTVTSPQNIKKLFVDWKDGTESWYEYEIVGTSKTASHVYTDHSGVALTPDLRVQDELGFWSGIHASSNTITPGDTAPTAKLQTNVNKDHVGIDVTLNAVLSQPKGSNVTITKYEFKRDASDSWQDNGANPVYTFDSGVYPNSVGVKTASVRLTVSSGVTPLQTDSITYELETGTPTELIFSIDTRVHEVPHTLGLDKQFTAPLEGDGVEYQFKMSRRAERITLHGTSHHPNMENDINKLRSAWLNDTFIRVRIKSEMESKEVLYDGRLEADVSLGQAFDNMINWSVPMVVFTRTEV